jgi:extradiol dioxygenase family protein
LKELAPFHHAFPVNCLDDARHFYGVIMGCPDGRSSDEWIDFNLFGHQIVAHLNKERLPVTRIHNYVDGKDVPVPHFGVVLDMEDWQMLADRLTKASIPFVIEPYVRFKGEPGEQATMFFHDPSGNALEFKAFADRSKLFTR